jgi:hypothetical protein
MSCSRASWVLRPMKVQPRRSEIEEESETEEASARKLEPADKTWPSRHGPAEYPGNREHECYRIRLALLFSNTDAAQLNKQKDQSGRKPGRCQDRNTISATVHTVHKYMVYIKHVYNVPCTVYTIYSLYTVSKYCTVCYIRTVLCTQYINMSVQSRRQKPLYVFCIYQKHLRSQNSIACMQFVSTSCKVHV